MTKKEIEKLVSEIQKKHYMRPERTKAERTKKLCEVGSLIEMLGLIEKNKAYLTGLLLQHFVINDKKRERIRKIGKQFFKEKNQKK